MINRQYRLAAGIFGLLCLTAGAHPAMAATTTAEKPYPAPSSFYLPADEKPESGGIIKLKPLPELGAEAAPPLREEYARPPQADPGYYAQTPPAYAPAYAQQGAYPTPAHTPAAYAPQPYIAQGPASAAPQYMQTYSVNPPARNYGQKIVNSKSYQAFSQVAKHVPTGLIPGRSGRVFGALRTLLP